MPVPTRNVLVVLIAILPTFAAFSSSAADDQLASSEARRLWLKGADQVLAGNFSGGATTLHQALQISPETNSIKSAVEWLDDSKSIAASRETFRKRMYDYYVGKALESVKEARTGAPADGAKKMIDRTNEPPSKTDDEAKTTDGVDATDDEEDEGRYSWSRALLYAQSAMSNATSEAAFRAEPWLGEIVTNVMTEIDTHKTKNEWRDALALYDILQRIYPNNEVYKDGFDFSRKRAHLEFVYSDERRSWKTDLFDVSADALSEIVDRISNDYVDEPNWRALCRSALDNLLILAETETLTETFPSLGEEDLVARFTVRLRGYIRRDVESDRSFEARNVKSVFRRVLEANRETINLPTEVIVDEFIAGMLDPMDDFTTVIWPSEVTEFNKQTRGEFVGVGIQITQEPGKPVRVESPLPDSPAYNAGIKPGDYITKVDGKSTIDMTINDAVKQITGVEGTTVMLSIEDAATHIEREVPLKRSQIRIRTVKGDQRDPSKPTGWDYMVDRDMRIGYIRVSGFMDDTEQDLIAALNQLHNEDCQGLILDLRFNPGGLLTSAVQLCEIFLGENSRIVMTKGRSRHQNINIHARESKKNFDLPMIVLVNEYSASASEIVAGALSGLKEACVIGSRSFGKGSVQNLIPIMSGRAYLKLTTAHYYVPDADMPAGDQWYLLHRKEGADAWGVEPHIKVDLIPQEVAKVLRLRRERDVLKGKNQQEVPEDVLSRRAASEPPENFPEDDIPDIDPQMVAAMNVMRMKLSSHQPWALAPRTVRTAANTSEMKEIRPSEVDIEMR